MSVQNWEHFFKPEVRSSGRALFKQGKATIVQPSDTEIIVYIRVSSACKVSLKTKSVASDKVTVDCNCPAGKKNQFCKHIWAALLATAEKNPDFFEAKTEIEKQESSFKKAENTKPELSKAREATQAAFKDKQATYRKEQYQKQKQRLKNYKELKKGLTKKTEYPSEVEKALNFFSQNGIELRESLNKEMIGSAKKKLARIFHPDRGGSHDEILDLNKFSDVLIGFAARPH